MFEQTPHYLLDLGTIPGLAVTRQPERLVRCVGLSDRGGMDAGLAEAMAMGIPQRPPSGSSVVADRLHRQEVSSRCPRHPQNP